MRFVAKRQTSTQRRSSSRRRSRPEIWALDKTLARLIVRLPRSPSSVNFPQPIFLSIARQQDRAISIWGLDLCLPQVPANCHTVPVNLCVIPTWSGRSIPSCLSRKKGGQRNRGCRQQDHHWDIWLTSTSMEPARVNGAHYILESLTQFPGTFCDSRPLQDPALWRI
jgi:hypothetical protein